MNCEVYKTRNDVLMTWKGRIVLEECEKLKNQTLNHVNRGVEQVFVDLSGVDFIDSAGLSVLVQLRSIASRSKARVVIVQPSKPVSDILYITKLDGVFEISKGSDSDAVLSRMVSDQNRVSSSSAGDAPSPIPAVSAYAGYGNSLSSQAPSAPPQPRPANTFSSSSRMYAPQTSPQPLVQPKPHPDLTGVPLTPNGDDVNNQLKSQRELVEEHCRKAMECMRQQHYEMSAEEYKKALAIQPDYLPALNNLAIIYEKQPSWHSKAIDLWEQILRISQQKNDQKHIDRAQRHLTTLRKMV